MDTHRPPRWGRRLMMLAGAPDNHENLRFLGAQALAEGGVSKWNPLNVTYVLSYGQSWPLAGNSAGVQNYYKAGAGIAATYLILIQTVPGANFAHLLGDFQSGTHTAEEIAERNRTELHIWGTGADAVLHQLATTSDADLIRSAGG